MEDLVSPITSSVSLRSLLENTYSGRRVLITGHNGFVGSWLSFVLANAGAKVTGLSLAEEKDGLSQAMNLSSMVNAIEGDINDLATVNTVTTEQHPEIVFHLAAQALVLPSYDDPLSTWSTNVMGTAHVLDALRREEATKACVVITSDKCYATGENAHVESDPLGGEDPYSASKAGAEMVAHSYRSSFFADHKMGLATARAGNIVGGGDWSDHRIVPDCIRAIRSGEPVMLRHPEAVRPWQHVLDAIAGYLRLGAAVLAAPAEYSSAWNFGPPHAAAANVGEFVEELTSAWRRHSDVPVKDPILEKNPPVAERTFLTLDSTKSHEQLGWQQLIDLHDTIDLTAEWYAKLLASQSAECTTVSTAQIDRFLELDEAFVAGRSEKIKVGQP